MGLVLTITAYSVNYAFAYIDPGSLRIVTMDAATEASLFSDTANLKIVKPDLKVFVSVGGWLVTMTPHEEQ